MTLTSPASVLEHPCLPSEPPPATPCSEARLTDRQRVGVLLQAAALLSHLEHAGWYLPGGFEGAAVTAEGLLVVPSAGPGRDDLRPQERLRALLRTLFRTQEGVAGRGEARRAARGLLAAWRQDLTSLAPDRAVAQVLDHAGFLWEPGFAAARRALVAVHARNDDAEPWIAGPGSWRRRLRARASTKQGLEELVSDDAARQLWRAPDDPVEEDEDAAATMARARRYLSGGRFAAALESVEPLPESMVGGLEARALYLLGRPGAARSLLRRLDQVTLPVEETVATAEVAVRLAGASGDEAMARRWIDRARQAAAERQEGWAGRAELVAAAAAFDRGDSQALRRHLEAARAVREDPEHGWRWLQTAALEGLEGEPAVAAEYLTEALGRFRRRLGRAEAAGLWNDLGVARAGMDDLAGAERAFLHGLRLLERCDGPRKITLALQNLAEIRVRRGRLRGVREILERARIENRRAGNPRGEIYDAALEARFELARGRPEAAWVVCREALERLDRLGADWQRPTLTVLAARALGWLGRGETASRLLDELSPRDVGDLEPEERPALWALAGDRERALMEAAEIEGPVRTLWQRLLTEGAAPASAWEDLGALEGFRFARLVFDAERVAPGSAPTFALRRAAAAARRQGSGVVAERLEARDDGPWRVLTRYLDAATPLEPETLGALFEAAGAGSARLWWERGDERAEVLLAGPGGDGELTLPAHGGRLVLRVPRREPVLEAFLRLIRRDFAPERLDRAKPEAGDLVGDSPQLRRALERLDRLAASELPVLVHGESGTGKELAARRLHGKSRRHEGPFVAVNCAALSETLILSDLFGHVRGAFTGADRDRAGVFETAARGTVFLDEIGDLPGQAQGMMLRVLQEGEVRRLGETLPRPVDVRVVAATHRDLEEEVAEGRFRQDLFFRLKGGRVTLPPLRDRGDDVLRLAEHLLRRHVRPDQPLPKLSEASRGRLLSHAWPGNVRELAHVLEAAVALADGDRLEPEHLDLPAGDERPPAGTYHARVDGLRRRLVGEALEAAGGNQSEAARRLGLSRQSMSYLVKRFGIG